MILALLARAWPFIACLGVGLGTGGYLEKNRWQARYNAVQTAHAQELAEAERKARERIQDQLEQFQATSANNARVIHDLQDKTAQAVADRARDRDLVQRLLNAAAERDSHYHVVSEADHQPGTPQAGESQGPDRLGDLLIATADESRACARQLNALILEIQPQL